MKLAVIARCYGLGIVEYTAGDEPSGVCGFVLAICVCFLQETCVSEFYSFV